MGTDERSILHIILRAQKARQRRNGKAPYGVTIHEEPIRGKLETCLNPEVLLLIPGQTPSWQLKASDFSQLAMYCPLYQNGDQIELDLPTIVHYDDSLPRDIAILDVVHTLDRF
jgi:hypothetical protein